MSEGWIKLHRQLKNSPIYHNSKAVHVWVECLLVAAHEGYKIDFRGEERSLDVGEFVFGRIAWSKRLGIPESTLHRWMKSLQRRGMIEVVSADRWRATIYRVVNWSKYQSEGGVRTGDRTGGGQVTDTNKKVKNERNNIDSKKTSSKEGIPVTDFQPRDNEQARCLEIAKDLGEPDMRWVLSACRDIGIREVEQCWGITKETKGIRRKGAYFNKLITERKQEILQEKRAKIGRIDN
jgi:hypothetical protein